MTSCQLNLHYEISAAMSLLNDSGGSFASLIMEEKSGFGFEDLETHKSKLRRVGESSFMDASFHMNKFSDSNGKDSNNDSGAADAKPQNGRILDSFVNGRSFNKPIEIGYKQISSKDRVSMENESKLNTDLPFAGNRFNNAYATTMPIKKRRIQLMESMHAFSTPSPPSSPSPSPSLHPSNSFPGVPRKRNALHQESVSIKEVIKEGTNELSDNHSKVFSASIAVISSLSNSNSDYNVKSSKEDSQPDCISEDDDDLIQVDTSSALSEASLLRNGSKFPSTFVISNSDDDHITDHSTDHIQQPTHLSISITNTEKNEDNQFISVSSEQDKARRHVDSYRNDTCVLVNSAVQSDTNGITESMQNLRRSEIGKEKEKDPVLTLTGKGSICETDDYDHDSAHSTSYVVKKDIHKNEDEKSNEKNLSRDDARESNDKESMDMKANVYSRCTDIDTSTTSSPLILLKEAKCNEQEEEDNGKDNVVMDVDSEKGIAIPSPLLSVKKDESNKDGKEEMYSRRVMDEDGRIHNHTVDLKIKEECMIVQEVFQNQETVNDSSTNEITDDDNDNDADKFSQIKQTVSEKENGVLDSVVNDMNKKSIKLTFISNEFNNHKDVKGLENEKDSVTVDLSLWNRQLEEDDLEMEKLDYGDSADEEELRLEGKEEELQLEKKKEAEEEGEEGSRRRRNQPFRYFEVHTHSEEGDDFSHHGFDEVERNEIKAMEKGKNNHYYGYKGEDDHSCDLLNQSSTFHDDVIHLEEKETRNIKERNDDYSKEEMEKNQNLNVNDGENSSLHRSKVTGWDKLPLGFDKPEEALKAIKEEPWKYGRKHHVPMNADMSFSERCHVEGERYSGKLSTVPSLRYGRSYNEELSWSRQEYFRMHRMEADYHARFPFSRKLHPYPHPSHRLIDNMRDYNHDMWIESRLRKGEEMIASKPVSPSRTSYPASVEFHEKARHAHTHAHTYAHTNNVIDNEPDSYRRFSSTSRGDRSSDAYPVQTRHLGSGFDLDDPRVIEASISVGLERGLGYNSAGLGFSRHAHDSIPNKTHLDSHDDRLNGKYAHAHIHTNPHSSYPHSHTHTHNSHYSRLDASYRRDVNLHHNERLRFNRHDWMNKDYDDTYFSHKHHRHHHHQGYHSDHPRPHPSSHSQFSSSHHVSRQVRSRSRSRSKSRFTSKSKSPSAMDRTMVVRKKESMDGDDHHHDGDTDDEKKEKVELDSNHVNNEDVNNTKRKEIDDASNSKSSKFSSFDIDTVKDGSFVEKKREEGIREKEKFAEKKEGFLYDREGEKEGESRMDMSRERGKEKEKERGREREVYGEKGRSGEREREREKERSRDEDRERMYERMREKERYIRSERERSEYERAREKERAWLRERDMERENYYASSRHKLSLRRMAPHVIHGSALTDERDRMLLAGLKQDYEKTKKNSSREGSSSHSVEGDAEKLLLSNKDDLNHFKKESGFHS